MHKLTAVFIISVIIAVAFISWGVLAPAHMNMVTTSIQAFITHELGWFYLLSATAFLIFFTILDL